MKGFNLTRLKPHETAIVELRSPEDQSLTGGKITIAGPTSETHREAAESLRGRRAALLRRYKEESKVPLDEMLASYRTFLVDITVGWEGMTDGPDDAAVAFSKDAARKAYENPSIVEQVSATFGDLAAFIRG